MATAARLVSRGARVSVAAGGPAVAKKIRPTHPKIAAREVYAAPRIAARDVYSSRFSRGFA